MKNPIFENNYIYHIYNRGVEKRDVFLDEQDYFRFVHDIFEFNDEAPAANIYYKLPNLQSYEVGLRKMKIERKPRKCLVDIFAFCLMTNHFHFLIRQKQENGISMFMQKLGTGYTNYFNKKYERVGPLFQGKFKAVIIETDAQLRYLPLYIHANPIDIFKANIKHRDKRVDDKQIGSFLKSYRWSSYPDYIGEKNFPSVTQREFLLQLFGDSMRHYKEMMAWVKETKLDSIKDVILE